jgi:hypothetical protein
MSTKPITRRVRRTTTRGVFAGSILRNMPKLNPPAEFAHPTRGKEHPVSLVQPRTGDLAAKNRQLVSKHHDLELLELARAQPQRRHREPTPEQQVQQRHDQEAASRGEAPGAV